MITKKAEERVFMGLGPWAFERVFKDKGLWAFNVDRLKDLETFNWNEKSGTRFLKSGLRDF